MSKGSTLPGVAIVILNWNRSVHTTECLECLNRIAYRNHGIVVADSCNSDRTGLE